MAYSQAVKEAVERYRQKNKVVVKELNKVYSRRYYSRNRDARVANVRLKREFVRLSKAFEAF